MPAESDAEAPQATGNYKVDESVIAALPKEATTVIHAQYCGESLWGKTVKINVMLSSGDFKDYFLKVIALESTGRYMCKGEFESLKAAHTVSPNFVPRPVAWGRFKENIPETYFLLAEFRDVGEQAVDSWEDSWCALYTRHLQYTVEIASPIINRTDFDKFSKLTIEKVVPRLLLPLQESDRVLKPCLVHGDCWDGNTAMDTKTGEAFVFDLCSFYGHNEYDTGNWRAPRHRLSNKAFITAYKRRYPVSQPEGEWDWRNLLYSLTFNIGNAIHIPGSSQEEVVIADMQTLCHEFCPGDIPAELKGRKGRLLKTPDIYQGSADTDDDEEEDRGSEAGSMSGSRQLTKPRFLESDFRSMAKALNEENTDERDSRETDYGTDIFDSS